MPASRIASAAAKLLVGLLAIVLVATAYVFAQSERLLRRGHEIPSVEGRRMAIIVGCLEGCHGQQREGGSEDAPGIFRATTPTLSEVLPSYSDPELVRLVRFGVKRDSMTAVGMPSPRSIL